jgi:hypothetical protein
MLHSSAQLLLLLASEVDAAACLLVLGAPCCAEHDPAAAKQCSHACSLAAVVSLLQLRWSACTPSTLLPDTL